MRVSPFVPSLPTVWEQKPSKLAMVLKKIVKFLTVESDKVRSYYDAISMCLPCVDLQCLFVCAGRGFSGYEHRVVTECFGYRRRVYRVRA